jgi:hypothetical protein
VAVRAVLRGGFVEQHRLALNVSFRSVAHGAGHICVRPGQRKLGALVVVKRGRRPALVHVTIPAFRDAILGRKLAAVRIGVTRLTVYGCALKLNLMCVKLRLVTFVAGDSAM